MKVECGANLPPSGWFLRELSHFVARAKENRPSERVPREQVLSVLESWKRSYDAADAVADVRARGGRFPVRAFSRNFRLLGCCGG